MTNKKTFKFQFSTLVIIALIAMLSVACKNKVTASANLSAEAGTEEIINGAEDKDIVDNKDAVDNKDNNVDNKDNADIKDNIDNKNTINEGSFVSGDFKATVKNSQITIEYKDAFGGQGPLVINAEGKTPIKAKNSIFGFNFIVNGAKLLVTDATPNYDANGNLSSILFDSKYDGQKFTVKF